MARITVEDCLEQIPNRFQLVLAATYRARMLSQGHAPKIESKQTPSAHINPEYCDHKLVSASIDGPPTLMILF